MDVKTVIDIVVWGLFGLIVLLTVFGLLAGLCKGLVKTTVKTVIKIILVITFIFVAPLLAKTLGNTDFSSFQWQLPCPTNTDGQITFNNILFTTPVEYFANFITGTGMISPMDGISVYQLALAIAYSLLSYFMFLILMIVAQLLISLVTAIIYNVFLRWFLPAEDKSKKKKHLEECHNNKRLAKVTEDLIDEEGNAPAKRRFKLHRGWGALLGAAQEFVFACTLVAPITSLARTAVDNKTDVNLLLNKLGQERYIDTANTCFKGVENSWVYKLLGTFNYDTLLMNKISSQNDLDTAFSVMVKDVFTVAEPILNSDAISGTYENGSTKITINYATLLSYTLVNQVIDSIVSNSAVMGLIPPLVDVALNYASAGSSLPLDEFDLSNVNWKSDITALKDIYEVIYSKGLKSIIKTDGTGFDGSKFKMETSKYTDDDIETICSAVKGLADLTIVQPNLAKTMAGLGGYLASLGFDLLPTEEQDYSDVKWGDDLSTLIKDLLKALRTMEIDLTFDNFQLIKADMLNDNENAMTVKVKAALKDETKRHALQELLTGDEGILAIPFIGDKVHLSPLVDTVIQSVGSLQQFTSTSGYQHALTSLDDSGVLRNEVNVIFSMMDILLDKDSPVTISNIKEILNSKDANTILSYINDDVCDELIDILDVAENSTLFTSLYGPLMKTYLYSYYNNNKNNENITQYLFGLTPYSFNYEADSFTSDIKKIIKLAPDLKEFYDKYSELSKKSYHDLFKGLTDDDCDLIGEFLTVVAESEFLNADNLDGASDQIVKNANITTILNNLFSVDALKSFKITLPSAKELGDVQWVSTATETGEIDNLVSILKGIIKNRDLILYVYDHRSELTNITSYKDLKNSVYKDLLKLVRTEEQQYAVVDLVIDCYNSDLLRQTTLNTITDRIQNYLNKLGIPFSLEELRTYAYNPNNKQSINEDLQSFRNLIPLLQKINYHEVYGYLKNREFGNLLRAIPTDTLNICLTTITTSNIYTHTNSTASSLIPIGFYTFMKKFGFFDSDSFNLTDYGWQAFDAKTYGTDWTTAYQTYTDADTGFTYNITTSGEIDVVIRLIECLQETDLNSIRNKKYPTYYPTNWLENNKDIFDDAYFRNLFALYEPSILNYFLDNYSDKIPSAYRSAFKELITYIDFDAVNKKDASGNYVIDLYSDAVICKDLAIKILTKYNGGERFFRYVRNHLTSMDDEALSRINDILEDIKKIDILYLVKDGKEMNVISAAVMEAMNYNSGKYLPYVTLSKAKDNKEILKSIVLDIEEEGWDKEFDRLYEVLLSAQGLGSLKDLSLYGTGRNETTMKKVFSAVNNSRLLHRAPIYLVKEAFTEANISSLIDTDKHPLEFDVNLDFTKDSIDYWQHDYDLFVEMIYDDELKDLFENADDFASLDFSSIHTRILYYFGSLHLFEDSRSDLIYSILTKYVDTKMGVPFINDIFLESDKTPYGEDEIAWRLEDLYFANPKLLDDNGSLDKEKALYDNAMLDEILDFLLKRSDVFKNANDFTAVYNALKNDDGTFTFFEDMTKKTLSILPDGTLYRSDFASEIVAGAMTMIVNNEMLSDYLGSLKTLDFYGRTYDSNGNRTETYELVNPVEGRALDQIIVYAYEIQNGKEGDVKEEVKIALDISLELGEMNLTLPYVYTYNAYYSKSYIRTLFASLEADSTYSDALYQKVVASLYGQNKNSRIATLAIQDKSGMKVGSVTLSASLIKAYIIKEYGLETANQMEANGLITEQNVDIILYHSALGVLPVKMSDGTYGYLDDAIDFAKLDTLSFTQLLDASKIC